MRRASSLTAAALASLASLFAGHASGVDLLGNGSFEQGPAIAQINPIYSVPPGNTALTGWTVTGGAISIVTDNYWAPFSGHRSIALSNTGPGSVEQSFASSPGAVYRLTFWLSGEPFSSPTIKHLRVDAGSTTQDLTYDITEAWHWDMAWTQHTLDFAAPGSSTTLRFSSMDASQWGPALDSVTVDLVTAGVLPDAGLAFAPVAPDPVFDSGRMTFTLAAAGRARLALYDVQGREAARLVDADLAPGPQTVTFSPRVLGLRPGLYLAMLQAGGRRLVRRFLVAS